MCPVSESQERAAAAGATRPLVTVVVRVSRETKGRKGKALRLISGHTLAEKELKSLRKSLRRNAAQRLATLKDGIVPRNSATKPGYF